MENPLNTGHGHVRPRPDGIRARCGGPKLCSECAHEERELAGLAQPTPTPELTTIARAMQSIISIGFGCTVTPTADGKGFTIVHKDFPPMELRVIELPKT